MPWTEADVPDQTDKIIVVTGANSGIGWETAQILASRGATIVMACRDEARAHLAAGRIRASLPDASLEIMALDLARQESVKDFAQRFLARFARLDVLVHNAGIMATPRRVTEDGFELQIATNHLGPFALTGLLFETLRNTRHARVVVVSSAMHYIARLRIDDLFGEKSYERWIAYANTKLANLLFSRALDRRCKDGGIDIAVLAAHPGYAETNLHHVGPAMAASAWRGFIARVGASSFAQTAAMGALPVLRAATDPNAASGDYYGPDGMFEIAGYPVKVGRSKAAQDDAIASALWARSEALTRVSFRI